MESEVAGGGVGRGADRAVRGSGDQRQLLHLELPASLQDLELVGGLQVVDDPAGAWHGLGAERAVGGSRVRGDQPETGEEAHPVGEVVFQLSLLPLRLGEVGGETNVIFANFTDDIVLGDLSVFNLKLFSVALQNVETHSSTRSELRTDPSSRNTKPTPEDVLFLKPSGNIIILSQALDS